MLLAFGCLEKQRTRAHRSYLQSLPFDDPVDLFSPMGELLTQDRLVGDAELILQGAIDADWRRTFQLWPLVVDHYFALKYAEVVQGNARGS
jgi:hypothetical protein